MPQENHPIKTIRFSSVLFLWLLCTILPFIGFSAWYAYQQAYKSTESYALQFADLVAEQVHQETARFLQQPADKLQALLAMGQANLLHLDNPEQLVRQLAVLQQQAPSLTFISFGYAKGDYVASVRPPLSSSFAQEGIFALENNAMNLSFVMINHDLELQPHPNPRSNARYDSRTRPWFQHAITASQASWYPVIRYQTYDSLGIGISSQVLNSQGDFLGVAATDVALNQLSRFLQVTATAQGGLYFVAETDGKLLAISDESPTFVAAETDFTRMHASESSNPVVQLIWQQHQQNRTGQMIATIDQADYVINLKRYALPNGPELLIAMAHPKQMFTAPLRQLATTLATVLLLLVALCTLVMFLVSRRVTKPLAALSLWAEQLSQQQWHAPEPSSGGITELKIVNHDLKQMAQQLETKTEQLAEKVEHRTKELNQTLMLLQHILRSAAGLSIIVTNPAGKVMLFNKGSELLTGYTAAEAMAHNSILFLHQQEVASATDHANFTAFIHQKNKGSSSSQLTQYQHKARGKIPVSLLVTPILDKTEQLSGYLFIAQDWTEQQKIMQMKNDFVSTVSHELRTPLTSIAAALTLLNSGVIGALTEKQQQLTGIAGKNCRRLQQLINDLLDMDKLHAGQVEFTMEPYAIRQLLLDAQQQNADFALEHQVHIELDIPDEEIWLNLDARRFQQIMSNLLSNAVKFSAANSDVLIHLQHQASTVSIHVIDRGCGIPKDFHHKLFEKFSQAGAVNTRNHQGTGLGLAICKQLTERMNGTIGFTSEEGKGSDFFVEFPQYCD